MGRNLSIIDRVIQGVVRDTHIEQAIDRSETVPPDVRNLLKQMDFRCKRISYAHLLLLKQGEIGEAQCIERTLIEASCRYLFVLTAGKRARERFNEFTRILPAIAAAKDQVDIERVLDSNSLIGIPSLVIGIDVSRGAEQKRVLEDSIGKEGIKIIEKDWSIFNVISKGFPYQDFVPSIIHRYAMSCHVSHADYAGLQISSFLPLVPGAPSHRAEWELLFHQLHWILAFSLVRRAVTGQMLLKGSYGYTQLEFDAYKEVIKEIGVPSPLDALFASARSMDK
jgi:hypothetical protein